MPLAEARDLLCLSEDHMRAAIIGAFRKAAVKAHPDTGGSAELFRRVVEARDRSFAALGMKAREVKMPEFAPKGVRLVYRSGRRRQHLSRSSSPHCVTTKTISTGNCCRSPVNPVTHRGGPTSSKTVMGSDLHAANRANAALSGHDALAPDPASSLAQNSGCGAMRNVPIAARSPCTGDAHARPSSPLSQCHRRHDVLTVANPCQLKIRQSSASSDSQDPATRRRGSSR
jgi:hypothetical protein